MSKLGEELIESMAEALAHAQGKLTSVRTHHFEVSPDSIQKARARLGLSQTQFANAFGVSASTLRKWEQGQRSPTGAAKTLLTIIENEPEAVERALRTARPAAERGAVTKRRSARRGDSMPRLAAKRV